MKGQKRYLAMPAESASVAVRPSAMPPINQPRRDDERPLPGGQQRTYIKGGRVGTAPSGGGFTQNQKMLFGLGAVLVGPSLGGKSTTWTILSKAMGRLNKDGVGEFQTVRPIVINPKAIPYASRDSNTREAAAIGARSPTRLLSPRPSIPLLQVRRRRADG